MYTKDTYVARNMFPEVQWPEGRVTRRTEDANGVEYKGRGNAISKITA